MGVKEIVVECSKCKAQIRRTVPVFVNLSEGTVVTCPKCAKKDGDEK